MSIVICERCDAWVDSDNDPEVFVEIGNMRRLHQTIVLCESCRDRDDRDRMQAESTPEYEYENILTPKEPIDQEPPERT